MDTKDDFTFIIFKKVNFIVNEADKRMKSYNYEQEKGNPFYETFEDDVIHLSNFHAYAIDTSCSVC